MKISQKEFREDINGLRAWAVIAVVFYHFAVPGFSGGFVGVDVFFVISGYLMTGIIYKKLHVAGENTTFWLIGFYLSRGIRILPALIVLVAILLVLGWFVLAPPDYSVLGGHAAAALVFLSNVQFWREAGYFDVSSHEKWLLQTWSLSVEWQFYLVLPLFMSLLWRFFPRKRHVALGLGAAFAASLVLSVYLTFNHQGAAFYLLPSRAWEMLAGGLVFLLANHWSPGTRFSSLLELLGLALIILSIFGLGVNAEWPGYLALMPVCGTVLVLLAAKKRSVWTHNKAAQKLGLWSYSIYLWHWPLFVALVYIEVQHQLIPVALGLVFSLLLGWASYTWVEKPSSQWLGAATYWKAIAALGLALATVAVSGVYARLTHGVPGRLSAEVELAANEALNFNPMRTRCHGMKGNQFQACVYGGSHIKVLLVGDSHAISVVSAIQASLPAPQDGVLAFTYTSCPTIFGAKHENASLKCAEFNDWVMAQIGTQEHDLPLIIVNRTTAYLFGSHISTSPSHNKPSISFGKTYSEPTSEFLTEFKNNMVASICRIALTRPVYLMRPIPEMPFDVPKIVARRLLMNKDGKVSISFDDYKRRHSFVWSVQDEAVTKCGAKIIDPTTKLCQDGKCMGTFKDRPLYYDEHHLSQYANTFLIGLPSLFEEALN